MTLFNGWHFLYLGICAIITLIFYFALRKRSERTKFIVLFIPLAIAFILHFLKLLIPMYRDNLPNSLVSLTPISPCALNTLIFPFIYLSKNKKLKDYMIVIGIISGLATLILPGDIINKAPNDIEVMRFFFAHLVIFLVPLMMLLLKVYTLSENWFKNSLILFLISLAIILVDGIVTTLMTQGPEGLTDVFKNLTK